MDMYVQRNTDLPVWEYINPDIRKMFSSSQGMSCTRGKGIKSTNIFSMCTFAIISVHALLFNLKFEYVIMNCKFTMPK